MCAIVLLAKKDRLQLLDAKSSGIPDDYVPESRFPCAERPIWLPRLYHARGSDHSIDPHGLRWRKSIKEKDCYFAVADFGARSKQMTSVKAMY
jgi:hypothetical protein